MLTPQVVIMREPEVLSLTGLGRTGYWTQRRAGVMPDPIAKMPGERTARYLAHEIHLANRAAAAGLSVEERRTLIEKLKRDRANLIDRGAL
jgi:predicted DNA-binding transcriptional regulator AlpA